MPIVAIASRIVSLLLCLFVAGPLSLPAQGHVSPKNRIWGSPGFSADFASKTSSQVAEPHRGSGGCGYDFAPGVHKYLYAHNDPVNGVDPSGRFTLAGSLTTTYAQLTLRSLRFPGLRVAVVFTVNSLIQARLSDMLTPLSDELYRLSEALAGLAPVASQNTRTLAEQVENAVSAPMLLYNVFLPTAFAAITGKAGAIPGGALLAYRARALELLARQIITEAVQG